jgi:hypothetical protein
MGYGSACVDRRCGRHGKIRNLAWYANESSGKVCILTHVQGKDYSNPRVSDFHTLNKPEEDMYDRTKTPRMPWCVIVIGSW